MMSIVDQAVDAKEKSYAPYSEQPMGAALRSTDGAIFIGSSVEFGNLSNSLHPLEVALANAIINGSDEIDEIAVTSPPCGTCLQTLSEFCDPDQSIIILTDDGTVERTLDELLPHIPQTRFDNKD